MHFVLIVFIAGAFALLVLLRQRQKSETASQAERAAPRASAKRSSYDTELAELAQLLERPRTKTPVGESVTPSSETGGEVNFRIVDDEEPFDAVA